MGHELERRLGQRKPGRQKAGRDQARERIIRSAIHLFSERGLHDSSLALIAKQAKVPPSLIIYYFKSRENLLKESALSAVSTNRGGFQAALLPEMNAFDQLMLYFRVNLEWVHQFKAEAKLMLLLFFLCSTDPALARFHDELIQGGIRQLEAILWAGKREGRFVLPKDPQVLARSLQSISAGYSLRIVMAEDPQSLIEQSLKDIEQLLKRQFNG